MTRMITKYLLLPVMLLVAVSCSFNTMYDETVAIEGGNWPQDKAARFDVNISDTLANLNFFVNIRNDNSYRYSNLYVFLTTHFPNGNITRDTIELLLADESGKWLGKGWGRIKEHKIGLKENLRFPLSGKYIFLLQHAMRDDTLTGITDVGLIFEKTD